MKESEIQNQVLKFLNGLPGARFYNLHGGALEGKGKPDVIGAYLGVPYAFELKTPIGKLSETQKKELKLLQRAGYKTAVCKSLKQVYETFKEGE